MPLMDGFEFIERLRRLPGCLDVPVFMITGQKSQTERECAMQLGAGLFREAGGPGAAGGRAGPGVFA